MSEQKWLHHWINCQFNLPAVWPRKNSWRINQCTNQHHLQFGSAVSHVNWAQTLSGIKGLSELFLGHLNAMRSQNFYHTQNVASSSIEAAVLSQLAPISCIGILIGLPSDKGLIFKLSDQKLVIWLLWQQAPTTSRLHFWKSASMDALNVVRSDTVSQISSNQSASICLQLCLSVTRWVPPV